MDVVAATVAGKAVFEWFPLHLSAHGHEMKLFVMRDAVKFDGVRHHANPIELQQIADLLGASMLTPKVVDLIWEHATIKFDSIVAVNKVIAANSTSEKISKLIDDEVERLGGDNGGLIDSVGKYWVITNRLLGKGLLYGDKNACNYGWPSSKAGSISDVTPKIKGVVHKVWQTLGFKHNDLHEDPSQTIRLMYGVVLLKKQGESTFEPVTLDWILSTTGFCDMISHEGPVRYKRQKSVPAPVGNVVLPRYAPPVEGAALQA